MPSEQLPAVFPAITQTLRVAPLTLAHKIVLWLLRYPLQRAVDLALALDVSVSTVHRHLGTLETTRWVDSIVPPVEGGNGVRCYYLTHEGLLAAAGQEHAEPRALARAWHADERGLLRLLPCLGQALRVQEMINSLVSSSPTALPSADGQAARIVWHWRRDYQHAFLSHQRRFTCHADAALVLYRLPSSAALEEEAACYSFLLLVEGFLETERSVIRQRLDSLLRYRESQERVASYTFFPPVLVVACTPHQCAIWQRTAMEVAVVRRVKPLQGAITVLSTSAHTISALTLPWQHLSARGPCRLQDICTPMPLGALIAEIMPPAAREIPSPLRGARTTSRMAKLVRGHLRQRAERVTQLASQGEKSGYERGEMTALLCLRLHPRHLALLRLLYRAPLLSVPEAAAISGMSASTMQRYLYDLRALDVVRVSGHRQQARYQVSESGLRFLAAVQQITIGRIAEQGSAPDGGRTGYVQRGVRMLRRNGRHTAGIYLLLRLLHETAQHERHHRVLWWETGAHSERSYRAQSTWRNLRPDAVFAYQVGARQLVAWVEWDEGSMTARDLAAKLYAYQRFLHAREWGSYDTSVIPILLFIVPEKAQERRVITIARAILAAAGIIVRSTTATRLRREGPLGAIWYPITPREPQATACYPLFTAEKPYPRDL